MAVNAPLRSGQRPCELTCVVQAYWSTIPPAALRKMAESAPPRPNEKSSPSLSTSTAPGATLVPAGKVYTCVGSLSVNVQPLTSTALAPTFASSTQSGLGFDDTSLMTTERVGAPPSLPPATFTRCQ